MKTVLEEIINYPSRRQLNAGFRSALLPSRVVSIRAVSAPPKFFKKLVAVDAVVKKRVQKNFSLKPAVAAGLRQKNSFCRAVNFFGQVLFSKKRFSFAVLVGVLVLAFFTGMVAVYQTSSSKAENQDNNLPPPAVAPPIPLAPAVFGPISKVSNDVLFNMTIAQLENYLTEALKTPQGQDVERLAERKAKLLEYFQEKNSPFVNIVDTLAQLKHWQLVLAISNSESTLGKRCYTNNCSGIGVEPGHPLWRTYSSTSDWAKDLDNLLQQRYNNWTLEQMNGVYNQPGSKNWLLAAKQVLEELQARGIE